VGEEAETPDQRAGANDMILGIDPGTHCGWALMYGNGTIWKAGVWNLLRKKGAGHEGDEHRLVELYSCLDDLPVHPQYLKYLIFEEAGHTPFQKAAQIAGQLEGVLILWAHDNHIPWDTIQPCRVKKLATGNGRADKKAMIAAARKLTGYRGKNDNEADARLIAYSCFLLTTRKEK